MIKDYARLLSSKENYVGSTSMAQSGSKGTFDNAAIPSWEQPKDPWIVDSGATDHMSTKSNMFSTYNPNPSKPCILAADGSPTIVSGEGNIPITSSMSLSMVLHLPNLSCNLLSICQITKALKYCVTFFVIHCVFQDLRTEKTIGHGKERGGLYYLELQEMEQESNTKACKSTSESSSEEQVWL